MNSSLFFKTVSIFLSAVLAIGSAYSQNTLVDKLDEISYLDVLPVKLEAPRNQDKIIIAVIDDGLRLSHKDFKGLVYENPSDPTLNSTDDDGNGKRDDVNGWDIADNDNDVNPPDGLEDTFYHGTFVCGSIVKMLSLCFNDGLDNLLSILPVKVLSDNSTLPDYSQGYKGIEYAIEQNADIIVCAWSGGTPSPEEEAIVNRALEKGIIIIGSAGNAYSGKADPPGSLPGVLTIAGVDSLIRKTASSNYGREVDLVAPAWKVKAAFPLADNSYFHGDGTSGASGIAAGCVAALKIMYPNIESQLIIEALINTAAPVDELNPAYAGKLGSGMIRLKNAMSYLADPYAGNYFDVKRTRGKIRINKKADQNEWEMVPSGSYEGVSIDFVADRKASSKSSLSFFTKDSLWFSSRIGDMPGEVFIPGGYSRILYDGRGLRKGDFHINYEFFPVDSSIIYCSDMKIYDLPEASISDGSMGENYANNSSCKWQIKAPPGTRIHISFSEFSTQGGVDFLYLFDGESTIPDNMLARFSGSKLPLSITSRTNNVLIWFVSDSDTTDKGWTLNYHFEDE